MLARWLDQEQTFLADLERLKGAQEIDQGRPRREDPRVLHPPVSRARDWLMRFPQRFIGRDMEALRAFVAMSAEAEDAERMRAGRLRRRILQGSLAASAVLALVAGVAGWQYFEAETARGRAVNERDRAARNFASRGRRPTTSWPTSRGVCAILAARRRNSLPQVGHNPTADGRVDGGRAGRSRGAAEPTCHADGVRPHLIWRSTIGDRERARAAAEESMAITRKLVEASTAGRDWQREWLSVSSCWRCSTSFGNRLDGACTRELSRWPRHPSKAP